MIDPKVKVMETLDREFHAEMAVILVAQKKGGSADISGCAGPALEKAVKYGDFKAKEKEICLEYDEETLERYQAKRVVFVGLGEIDKKSLHGEQQEILREAGGVIAKQCRKVKASCLSVQLSPALARKKKAISLAKIAEGLFLGAYSFTKYKEEKEEERFEGIQEIAFLQGEGKSKLKDQLKDVMAVSKAVCSARDMANEPGSYWTPESFAGFAENLASDGSLTCSVLGKKELEKLGMGGILAVNRGSGIEPKLIAVEYRPNKKAKTLLVVGKGITFDSGGISLKPAAGMEEMKYDMCGGATALALMDWVRKARPEHAVVALVPATDNMSGENALKPGDIIFHYNKMSSEVVNTDAEGRLLLADALSYGIEKYSPDCVIDLATLTGAAIVALGHHYTGLFSNNDKLAKALIQAGDLSGEPLWRLPLGKQYEKQIESKVADMKNTGGRDGGAITAAEYLHKFVGETPWAHLDIAGTAWSFTEKTYIPAGGASGICVRLLIDFVRQYK